MSKKSEEIFNTHLGCEPILINSNLLTAQNRPRLYWTNFKFPQPKDRGVLLEDVLEDLPFRPLGNWVYGKWGAKDRLKGLKCITDKKANCLTTKRSHNTQYYLNKDKTMYRNLSRSEAEVLQGFPKGYTKAVSLSQAFKGLGNSFTVPIIAHILKYIS